MIKTLALLVMLLPGLAVAESTVQPVAYVQEVVNALKGKATTIETACDQVNCKISWKLKPGAAKPSFRDRKKDRDAMRILYSKWAAGDISPEEKDRLLLYLAAVVLK